MTRFAHKAIYSKLIFVQTVDSCLKILKKFSRANKKLTFFLFWKLCNCDLKIVNWTTEKICKVQHECLTLNFGYRILQFKHIYL